MRRIASLTGCAAAAATTLLLLAPGAAHADEPTTGGVGDSVGFGLDVATASVDLGHGIAHGVIGD